MHAFYTGLRRKRKNVQARASTAVQPCGQYNSTQHARSRSHEVQHDPRREHNHATTKKRATKDGHVHMLQCA
eukprot:9380009-Alexandrium_andersonii.AAC.1